MTNSSLLFSAMTIGKLSLPGRLMKSATVETRCTADGYITEQYLQHYEEIAQGGTPLIITGAASYNAYSRGVPYQLSVDDDDKIPGLTSLADTVHRYGAKIMVQIYHTGRQAAPVPVGRIDAQGPSPVREPALRVTPREMSVEEIQQTIDQYAQACVRCKSAGMDGVQIHAAHGYLISAFLSPHTNRRSDRYGGSFDNRLRFLIELYREVRQRVGDDFPLILKLNGSDDLPFRKGLDTPTLVAIAQRLEREGIDAVEISAGHYESGFTFERGQWRGYTTAMLKEGMGRHFSKFQYGLMRMLAPLIDSVFSALAKFSPGFNLGYARHFKQALSIPVICVGGMNEATQMEQALQAGDCDMIAVARGLVADPYLYRHMQEGRNGPVCNYCNACFSRPGVKPLDCYDPQIKAERDAMLAAEQPLLGLT